MLNKFSISLKRSTGERIYLKSFPYTGTKHVWTTEQAERFKTASWREIEGMYNELLDQIHRYEQRQCVTNMPLAEYLVGQPGNLDILESRRDKDVVVTCRRVEMK